MFILKFLGLVIILAIFFVLFIGLSLVSTLFGGFSNLMRMLFGVKQQEKARGNNGYTRSQKTANTDGGSTNRSHNSASNGKIFGADEGVYVDFEEIK